MEVKIEKYINLGSLPKKNGNIDWEKSIGYKCSFLYNKIHGDFKIIKLIYKDVSDITSYKLIIEFMNIDFEIDIKDFKKCNIHNIIYSIPIRAPWMIDFFQGGINEAKNYTINTKREIFPRCVTCGSILEKKVSVNQIYTSHKCGCECEVLNASFPETVIYNILKNSNIKFKHQLTKTSLSWVDQYRYDFYLPNHNCIIETHGAQHYKENTLTQRTLNEEQENDKNKRILARNNGILNYVELDCSKSEINWILQSFFNSNLPKLLNISFDDIDQTKLCKSIYRGKYDLCTSLVKNNPYISLSTLSIKLNIASFEQIKELLHLCNLQIKKTLINPGADSKAKPIDVYKDNEYIYTFPSYESILHHSDEICGFEMRTKNYKKYIGTGKIYKKHYTFKYHIA